MSRVRARQDAEAHEHVLVVRAGRHVQPLGLLLLQRLTERMLGLLLQVASFF